jgi:FAD:protein FMN transferase
LQQCLDLSRACDGAFDVTVGPLVRTWRTAGEAGVAPSTSILAAAQRCVESDLVHLDEDALTVSFGRQGVALDLGAAGKGYAIDLAVDTLREAGVASALIHGGTSSVHAIGAPPDDEGWRICWEGPTGDVCLRDAALSVSAPHGRTFELGGVSHGHVIDPRTGLPVRRTQAAGVTGPSSLVCDALSTALLVLGVEAVPNFRQQWPAYDGWANAAS